MVIFNSYVKLPEGMGYYALIGQVAKGFTELVIHDTWLSMWTEGTEAASQAATAPLLQSLSGKLLVEQKVSRSKNGNMMKYDWINMD